jgi:hypothetical protein
VESHLGLEADADGALLAERPAQDPARNRAEEH